MALTCSLFHSLNSAGNRGHQKFALNMLCKNQSELQAVCDLTLVLTASMESKNSIGLLLSPLLGVVESWWFGSFSAKIYTVQECLAYRPAYMFSATVFSISLFAPRKPQLDENGKTMSVTKALFHRHMWKSYNVSGNAAADNVAVRKRIAAWSTWNIYFLLLQY